MLHASWLIRENSLCVIATRLDSQQSTHRWLKSLKVRPNEVGMTNGRLVARSWYAVCVFATSGLLIKNFWLRIGTSVKSRQTWWVRSLILWVAHIQPHNDYKERNAAEHRSTNWLWLIAVCSVGAIRCIRRCRIQYIWHFYFSISIPVSIRYSRSPMRRTARESISRYSPRWLNNHIFLANYQQQPPQRQTSSIPTLSQPIS